MLLLGLFSSSNLAHALGSWLVLCGAIQRCRGKLRLFSTTRTVDSGAIISLRDCIYRKGPVSVEAAPRPKGFNTPVQEAFHNHCVERLEGAGLPIILSVQWKDTTDEQTEFPNTI